MTLLAGFAGGLTGTLWGGLVSGPLLARLRAARPQEFQPETAGRLLLGAVLYGSCGAAAGLLFWLGWALVALVDSPGRWSACSSAGCSGPRLRYRRSVCLDAPCRAAPRGARADARGLWLRARASACSARSSGIGRHDRAVVSQGSAIEEVARQAGDVARAGIEQVAAVSSAIRSAAHRATAFRSGRSSPRNHPCARTIMTGCFINGSRSPTWYAASDNGTPSSATRRTWSGRASASSIAAVLPVW